MIVGRALRERDREGDREMGTWWYDENVASRTSRVACVDCAGNPRRLLPLMFCCALECVFFGNGIY